MGLLDTLLASEFTRQLVSEQRVNQPYILHAGMRKPGHPASSAIVLSEIIRRNLVIYKLLTGRVNYIERVYSLGSELASE